MAVLNLCLGSPLLMAADDPYLRALEDEVDKVEPHEIGTDRAAPAASSEEARKQTALVRDRFETLLRKRYAGTYSFYVRLPERSRQEIVAGYRSGADITRLRQMIIDRFYESK